MKQCGHCICLFVLPEFSPCCSLPYPTAKLWSFRTSYIIFPLLHPDFFIACRMRIDLCTKLQWFTELYPLLAMWSSSLYPCLQCCLRDLSLQIVRFVAFWIHEISHSWQSPIILCLSNKQLKCLSFFEYSRDWASRLPILVFLLMSDFSNFGPYFIPKIVNALLLHHVQIGVSVLGYTSILQ